MAHRGPPFFAYSANYLIDVDNAIIVDVEATTAIRQAETLAAERMVERSLQRFDHGATPRCPLIAIVRDEVQSPRSFAVIAAHSG